MITVRGQILVSRTDGDSPPPLPPPCVDSERPRVYVQNVPVCTGTTRTCFNTCARGAGIHGGRFECTHVGVFEAKYGFFHVFSACHNTHTPKHNHDHQQHHDHNDTQHHTERERQGDRERQRKRDKTGEDKRRRHKTRRQGKMKEERRDKTREEKREERR